MTAERPFYIYCHTAPNGKRYIGQTCMKPETRWSNGYGYRDQTHFKNAIQKYGWDNFDHQILCVVHSKKLADIFEQYYIAKYDTFNRDNGYNLTKGGGGRVGYKMSDDERRKLSERSKGRIITDEQRKKISDTLKSKYKSGELTPPPKTEESLRKMSNDRMGAGNPMFGRHHTKEAAERIGSFSRGKKHSEEWKRHISEGRYKSNKVKRCPVWQYDFDGNLIGHYQSLRDAEKQTGFASTNIRSCAIGKFKQAYGYIWSYSELTDAVIPNDTALV